tara:strand:- start:35 stop:568 length:534 start_codon:yes stop_codon:yes gene_type:complete
MSNRVSNFIVGIYEDEDVLLKAISRIREEGIKIYEVYSPFPVHGIENSLGYKRSRLSIAAFCFGFLGTCLALTMMIGMMTLDWPMIIGGKDFLPLPVFIPVVFEMTVLLSAFGMVGTFLVVSDLKPWGNPKTFDLRSTDNKHIMAIQLDKNKMKKDGIEKLLKSSGASEINEKTMDI